MNLCTTDNNCGVPFSDTGEKSLHGTKSDYDNLSKIANTTVAELVKNNPSLLVFPQILGAHDDGIDEQEVFNLHGNPEKLEDVKLNTGNLMGFVGIGDTQLKISSRFAKDDEHDFFLHYMLEKVFSINLFDYKYTSESGRLDLLMFSFPPLLKKALAQGIFRQYQTFNRNDANVKGVVDMSRHIKQNVPFCGKIAYNSRERTFDNPLTELIRHTIESIKTKPFGKQLLSSGIETKKCVQEIIEATQNYNFHEREKVIAQNLKPITHPYYTAYKPLQKLCLAILRHKKIGFGNAKNKVYGILFDSAWLWEEYLWTILKSKDFLHPQNKKHAGGIKMFENDIEENSFDKNHRRIYPDFYKPNKYILDAKYKRLQNGVAREDLYQIVTYMHTMKIDHGGFLYPISKSDFEKDIKDKKPFKLAGYGGAISTIGFPIPKSESFGEFVEKMEGEEKKLLDIIDPK